MVNFSQLVRESAKKGKLSPSLTILEETWDVLVGPEVAEHVRPLRLKGNTLVVMVRPLWVNEWTRNKTRILEAIGQYLPGIHNLEFEEGELPRAQAQRSEPRADPETNTSIEATFDRILERVMKERQQ